MASATSIDTLAPLVAAALYLVADLGYCSIELRWPARIDSAALVRRAARAGAIALVALGGGLLLLLVATLPLTSTLLLTAAGTLAAVGALGVTTLLAWRAV